jgi:hypothetical protein
MEDQVKIILLGGEGDKWPMLDSLWDFYNQKGVKTVFVSVGTGRTALIDLELAETLGCAVHLWGSTASWDEVRTILKDRKLPEGASDFAKGAETKWVLPKNVRSYAGTPGITVSFDDCVHQTVESMKLTEPRIDILKISLTGGAERKLIYALVDTPYRPGLILVDWSEMPDAHLFTTLVAGHLQNCGYCLVASHGSHFLYMFNDKCMYEYCSWETNKVPNPLVTEIMKIANSQV